MNRSMLWAAAQGRGRFVVPAIAASVALPASASADPALSADESKRPPSLLDAPPREVFGFPPAFTPIASQQSEVWWNPLGGFRTEVVYSGLLTFGAHVDFGEAGWIPGGAIEIRGLGIQGDNISTDAIGDAGIVSNIAGVPTVRLFKWWYEQSWLDESVRLKAGQLGLDDDFMLIDSAQLFLHSAFGTPLTQAVNARTPIYPLAALGLRLAVEPNDDWEILFGVYDGDAGLESENRHVPDLALSADQGALLFAEVSWRPSTSKRPLRLALGGFAHVGLFADNETGDERRGVGSTYVMLEHTVARWRGSDVTVFSHAEVAFPFSRTSISGFADAGITVSGGVWSRPDDTLGLAVAGTVFAEPYVAASRRAGDDVTAREATVELTYELVPIPWVALQSSAQWIVDPHFSGADALVFGTRLSVTY